MNDAALAKALWDARLEGGTLDLQAGDRPADADAAYAVLRHQVELGGPLAGWKIGAGAPGGMALLGLDAPFAGPVHERFVVPSGGAVTIAPDQAPGLETEFLVRLSADLPAREEPYDAAEVAAATAGVAPAFEIIGQRVPGSLEGNGPLVIADSAGQVAVVVGEAPADWRDFDLGRTAVRTSVDGVEKGAGDFGPMIWDDPLAAVGWLATHPLLAGRGLRAGEFVMTGTCAGLILPVSPGEQAVGDFGDFGSVRARFA